MAHNGQSFAPGNSRALRLTDEIRDLFIATMRMTGRTTICAQRCGISNTTAKDWIRRGRDPDADEIFRDFTAGVDRARSEFLLTAAGRLKQLALGGVLELPCYDKANNLVRDKDGNMIFSERFFPPDVRALTFILDRCDPQPREPEPEAPPGSTPELTRAEQMAEATQYLDLFRAGIQTLLDLGVPLPQIAQTATIETTATKVTSDTPIASNIEPTEPAKPKPPSVDDAF